MDRLERAKSYLTIAESKDARREAYKRAAEEIVAHQAETGETWSLIARNIGRDKSYISKLIRWYQEDAPGTPFRQQDNGTKISHARWVLENAELEVIEQLFLGLSQDRRETIAKELWANVFKELEYAGELERRSPRQLEKILPAKEWKRREEVGERLAEPLIRSAAILTGLTSVTYQLAEATETLRQVIKDGGLTPKAIEQIQKGLDKFQQEFDFAKQLIGGR